jgi:hypothetical protein
MMGRTPALDEAETLLRERFPDMTIHVVATFIAGSGSAMPCWGICARQEVMDTWQAYAVYVQQRFHEQPAMFAEICQEIDTAFQRKGVEQG